MKTEVQEGYSIEEIHLSTSRKSDQIRQASDCIAVGIIPDTRITGLPVNRRKKASNCTGKGACLQLGIDIAEPFIKQDSLPFKAQHHLNAWERLILRQAVLKFRKISKLDTFKYKNKRSPTAGNPGNADTFDRNPLIATSRLQVDLRNR